MPCGYRLEETVAQTRPLCLRSRVGPSYPRSSPGKVYAVNGSWYFNRPGPG